MDLWVILTIFAGTLGVLGLTSFFVPGIAQYVAAFFTTIVNLLRQAIQFVLDHSPRPIKLLLFIGLFSLVGIWAYNLSYGASLVCMSETHDEIGRVGYIEGVALKLLPTNDPWEEEQFVNQGIDNGSINPAPSTRINQPNGSTLLYKVPNVGWFGKSYDVVYATLPRTEALTGYSISRFFAEDDADIWDEWYNGESSIRYDVCLDTLTNTCILDRGGISTAPCIPVAQDAFGTLANFPWQQPVGRINYYAGNDGQFYARFDSGTNFVTDGFTGIVPFAKGPESCTIVDDVLIEEILSGDEVTTDEGRTIVISEGRREAYERFLSGDFGYTILELVDQDVFFDDEFSIPIYDISYVAVAKTETSNTSISTAASTLNPSTGQTSDTRQCTEQGGECDVYDLLGEVETVTFSKNDAFRVVCNTDTDDPFDTKPLLMGMDILNWKLMAMFVLIGALFSLYAWLKNL